MNLIELITEKALVPYHYSISIEWKSLLGRYRRKVTIRNCKTIQEAEIRAIDAAKRNGWKGYRWYNRTYKKIWLETEKACIT